MIQLKSIRYCFAISVLSLFFWENVVAQALAKPKYRNYENFTDGHHRYSISQTEFPNAGVADDFGPRKKPGYDWHSGIDYNGNDAVNLQDENDLILAVESGVVKRINMSTQGGVRYVIIEGQNKYAYEHIFTDINAGGCIWHTIPNTMPNDDNRFAIIFQINGEYSAISATATSITFQDESGKSRALTTKTSIAQGDPVAALGGSTGYEPHFHLEITKELSIGRDKTASNPLQFIKHDISDYTVDQFGDGMDKPIKLVYPGDKAMPLSARVNLKSADPSDKRYKEFVADIEKVEFKAITCNNNWWELKGKNVDMINFGGKIGVAKQPESMLDKHGKGNSSKTGVDPFAYFSQKKDEFYFPSFIPRLDVISKSLTKIPWRVSLPEGNLTFKTVVSTVNDKEFFSNPTQLVVDNFQPFIRDVQIRLIQPGFVNETLMLNSYWEVEASGKMSLTTKKIGLCDFNPSVPAILSIIVKSSEGLTSLTASLWEEASPNDKLVGNFSISPVISTDECGEAWKGNFVGIVPFNKCIKVIFKGKDSNNNQLVRLKEPNCDNLTSVTDQVRVRVKESGIDQWEPKIANPKFDDYVHRFKIENSCPFGFAQESVRKSDCDIECGIISDLVFKVKHLSTNGLSNGEITPSIKGLGALGVKYAWYNSQGGLISDLETISNLSAGDYCVKVVFKCCSIEDCFEIKDCNLTITPSIKQPAYDLDNGEIALTTTGGEEPYTYLWSTGDKTNTLSNLASGTYCVTVTDGYGCSKEACYVLEACNAITYNPNLLTTNATTCVEPYNGSIRILGGIQPTGGVAPYTLHWENGQGATITPPITTIGIGPLAPGTYCHVAQGINGCRGRKCVEITAPGQPVLPLEDLTSSTPVCPGASNGTISVTAISPNGTDYDWEWDNGAYCENAEVCTISGLDPGTYCVTLTNVGSGCTFTHCASVNLATTTALALTSSLKHPCSDSPNGSISVSVNGGQQPYSYMWSKANAPNSATLSGVTEGTYAVTVTDYCGQTIVRPFQLKGIRVKLNTSIGCNSIDGVGSVASEISAAATNGNPFYTYLWSSGQTTSTIGSFMPNTFTVTVTDSRGCSVIKSSQAQVSMPNINTLIVTPGCGPNNGSVSFDVLNPSLGGVVVLVNGVSLYTGGTGQAQVPINLAGLTGKTLTGSSRNSFTIKFENGCTSSFDYTVGVAPLDRRFVQYNVNTEMCVYDDYCGDVLMASNAYMQPRYEEWQNASSHPCYVPLKCRGDDRQFGKLEFDKVWIRAAQYRQILRSALVDSRYSSAYITTLLDYFNSQSYGECKRLKYCPASLKITYDSGLNNNGTYTVDRANPNCGTLDCGLFSHYYCLGDILPPSIPVVPPTELCNPVEVFGHYLLDWQSRLESEPGFIGSGLETFLDEHWNDKEMLCTKVTFCLTDWRVLYHNLETIDCTQNTCQIFPSSEPGGPDVVICPHECDVVGLDCGITHIGQVPYPVWPKAKGSGVLNRDIQTDSTHSVEDKNSCFAFSPNPFNNLIFLQTCELDFSKHFFVEIVTIGGQRLGLLPVESIGDKLFISSGRDLSAGIYLATIRNRATGELKYTQKLIKQY
jgi:SprB repeat